MSEDAQLTGPTTLEIVRTLPGPIERVWAYLTQSDLREAWICAGDVEAREGGVIVMDFDHTRLSKTPAPDRHKDWVKLRFEGRVTAYQPPHRLSFTWPEADGGDTEVSITLTVDGDRVRLHLVHDRLTAAADRTGAAAGWHAHLELLDALLAGEPPRDFWPLHDALEAHYASKFTVRAEPAG